MPPENAAALFRIEVPVPPIIEDAMGGPDEVRRAAGLADGVASVERSRVLRQMLEQEEQSLLGDGTYYSSANVYENLLPSGSFDQCLESWHAPWGQRAAL